MQKSVLKWRKQHLLLPGISLEDCVLIQQDPQGRTVWSEEGRETSGGITSISRQAMHSKENSASHCAFSSCPCIFWNCTEDESRSSQEISLTDKMPKTRRITQMRFREWLRTGAAGARIQ